MSFTTMWRKVVSPTYVSWTLTNLIGKVSDTGFYAASTT